MLEQDHGGFPNIKYIFQMGFFLKIIVAFSPKLWGLHCSHCLGVSLSPSEHLELLARAVDAHP